MMEFEDFALYLPRYLSEDETGALFNELRGFPDNIDGRIYTSRLRSEPNVFQGDVIVDLPFFRLPHGEVRQTPCMVLSNTCDISPANKRLFSTQAVYAAILKLESYESILGRVHPSDVVDSHIKEVRRQRITSMLYLPKDEALGYEGIVLLDSICSCPMETLYQSTLYQRRLLTLSDYGFYLLLLKLSIHFSRIRENVRRG